MHERSTVFSAAIFESRSISSNSPSGRCGRFESASGVSQRIAAGTVASASASRLSKPSKASIAFVSPSSGPMWRRAKVSPGSRRVGSAGKPNS